MVTGARNAEIDWLRGYAVLLVIVMHGALIGHGGQRYEGIFRWIHPATGVDLFFVISGFVISQTFIAPFDKLGWGEQRRFAVIQLVVRFYIKRLYRLYPAALAWISICLFASWGFNQSGIWLPPADMWQRFIGAVTYTSNFVEAQSPSVLGYYWSLAVEMQFYAVLPLFLVLLPQRRMRRKVLLVMFFAQAFWRPGGQQWVFFRFDALLLGLLLHDLSVHWAFEALRPTFLHSARARFFFLSCLMGIIVTLPVALHGTSMIAWTLISLACVLLVWPATYSGGFITALGLPRVMTWVGERSYSIYLCHIPTMLLNREIWFRILARRGETLNNHDHWHLLLPSALIGIAIAAELTHRLLESPFQNTGRDRASAFVVASAARAERVQGGVDVQRG